MVEETPTIEEIKQTIRAAKDSVTVINETIQEIADGETANEDRKDNIQRNVDHLKNVVARTYIAESGEDLSELEAGITAGDAELAKDIWTTE